MAEGPGRAAGAGCGGGDCRVARLKRSMAKNAMPTLIRNTIAMIAVLAVAAILSARASYRYYREAKEKQQG